MTASELAVWLLRVDSVEKLISQAHGILPANAKVAENPH
jgi:hypothetical protein